jgi:hypothetical protein
MCFGVRIGYHSERQIVSALTRQHFRGGEGMGLTAFIVMSVGCVCWLVWEAYFHNLAERHFHIGRWMVTQRSIFVNEGESDFKKATSQLRGGLFLDIGMLRCGDEFRNFPPEQRPKATTANLCRVP